jgi:FMN-dependent NADH-azoreductase
VTGRSAAGSPPAKDAWLAAHPGGTVTDRDLGSNPLPHFDAATGLARLVPPELRTPAQAGSWALTEELIGEIREADTILLGFRCTTSAHPAASRPGSTTSSRSDCRSMPRPGVDGLIG